MLVEKSVFRGSKPKATMTMKSELKTEQVEQPEQSRPRVVLTRTKAREIFMLKECKDFYSLHAGSLLLAKKYRVSSKAIRDIWNGRSWLEATFDLWEVSERPARKQLGRPKGRKDSKPRQTKVFKVKAPAMMGPTNLLNQLSPETVQNAKLFSDAEKIRLYSESHINHADEIPNVCLPSAGPKCRKPEPLLPPIHISMHTDSNHLFSQPAIRSLPSLLPYPYHTPQAPGAAAAAMAGALLLGHLARLFPTPALALAPPCFGLWPPC
jgi:hypothetical protein